MSRTKFNKQFSGNKVQIGKDNDIDQKLTYQQLLNINRDYAKENLHLKNISSRLGQELRSLHTQFQIKPRDESHDIYHAIGTHPVLQQYEHVLIPLLDSYEAKIQEFEHDFEQLHEQFFFLEKKFEDACLQNSELRVKLTDKIKELLEVYRSGGSEKMNSDFGQIILNQINEKQKCLVEENTRLERDYQKHKSESERFKNQLMQTKENLDTVRVKTRDYGITEKQLQSEIEKLKENVFELQIKVNEIQIEKKKLEQANERAQSQNIQLTKQKQAYKGKLDELRKKIEKQHFVANLTDHQKIIGQLKTRIAFLQAEQGPNDYPKRYSKLQKEFDSLMKEKNRIDQALQASSIKEDSLNQIINDLKRDISKLNIQKSQMEINESRIKKSLENLTEKSKSDILKVKKLKDNEMESLELEFRQKLQTKDRTMSDMEDQLSKVKLERDKLEKQNIINTKESKVKSTKESERTIDKLKEKLSINEELFREQIQIFENDLSYLKKETDVQKNECKQKTDELKKLRAHHEQLKKEHEEVSQQKDHLIQEFRRVRNEYETNLKDKERIFEDKIKQVKAFVQESDAKRRSERERVQESARQYKRVLEDLKATYDARIKELESQLSQSRYKYESVQKY